MSIMRIVLIEDNPAELERAEYACAKIAQANPRLGISWVAFCTQEIGLEEIFSRLDDVRDVDGVVTDLHFNPRVGWRPADEEGIKTVRCLTENPPPAGLVVVLWCVTRGIPVVICTDAGHHGPQGTWINDVWSGEGGKPFGYCDSADGDGRKSWARAVQELGGRILRKEKKS